MTTEQLVQIIKETPDQVTEVLSELSPHIREAAIVSLAASQDSEKAKAAVSVGLTLSINLATSPVSWKLEGAVSVRHKVAGEDQVADPTPELAPVSNIAINLPVDPETSRAALFARAMELAPESLARLVRGLKLVGWYQAAIEGAARVRAESDAEGGEA